MRSSSSAGGLYMVSSMPSGAVMFSRTNTSRPCPEITSTTWPSAIRPRSLYTYFVPGAAVGLTVSAASMREDTSG